MPQSVLLDSCFTANTIIDPEVSVVMAVNRDDGFLQPAIDSVLAQSMANFEFLVIANNCSDELWNGLQKLAMKDGRLRPIRTPIGQLPYNLNVGLHYARAEFIARMDADDISLPDRLERQVHYLRTNPAVSVVGANYELIDEHSRRVNHPVHCYINTDEIHARLPFETCMAHPTVMMRRADVLKVGGYAYGLYAEDWDLWLRMRRAGMRFSNLQDTLLLYRMHSGQSTSVNAWRRNLANVEGLLFRELILSNDLKFMMSMLRHFASQCKRQIVTSLRRLRWTAEVKR